jgi:hypothetical protein
MQDDGAVNFDSGKIKRIKNSYFSIHPLPHPKKRPG